MSEDIKITMPEGVDPEKKEDPQSEAPEYTEIEQEAIKHGWRPETEFEARPGKQWKTAEKFMADKPLYDKIDEQHKTIKKLERATDMLRSHYEKVEKAAYDRAVAELKAERKQALEEGDLVRAEDLRDQIEEKKAEAPKAEPKTADPQTNQELVSWKQRNDWYEKDEDMTAFADGLGNKLLAQGVNPTEILETVEKKVKGAFPQKFRNPNRDSAPRVEGGSSKKGKSGEALDWLSSEETAFMERFLKSGAPITREEYLRDLKKVKGVK
jgi:hypothetical protein